MKRNGDTAMRSNYFCNVECEYFPCHSGMDKEGFNCLFCYCPLYTKVSCPGNPQYVTGMAGQRIKDCSQCSFPHIPDNYDRIVAALTDCLDIITVRSSELYDTAKQLLAEYSSFSKMETEERKRQEHKADSVYQNIFAKKYLFFGLQPFEKSCIKSGYFQFGKRKLTCHILERIPASIVRGGYFAVFHAPGKEAASGAYAPVADKTEYGKGELLTQYYEESWQNALLDAGRSWISNYLTRKESVRMPAYVTDSFGPGFYGMPITDLPQLAELIDMERVGVHVTENGTLSPQKSLVCLYLVLNQPLPFFMKDCAGCIGSKGGCVNCGAYHRL